MGFSAAGFFGKLNENIDNQRDYIRARVDEDRKYLRGEGLKRQAGIKAQRGQYEEAANQLIRRGADEQAVLGLLQMDPKGLMQVHATNYSGAELAASFSIAEDYKGEATMSEILAKIVPAIQTMPEGSSPEKVKRRSLGAFLGLDLDTELNDEVYSQQIVGGMTGDDILSTVGTPISATGSNPSGVSYNLSREKSLTAAQRNGLFATANSDYTQGMVDDVITGINDMEPLPGETPEELESRKDQTNKLATAFEAATGAERLGLGVQLFGMGAETKGIFDAYGSTLFNPFNGISSTLFDTLSKAAGGPAPEGAESVDTEARIRLEAAEVFAGDPTLTEYKTTVNGTEVIVTPEDLKSEPVPAPKVTPTPEEPEGLGDGLTSSLRPPLRPDLQDTPEGLGDRRAARNEGMEPSVEAPVAEIEELQAATDVRNKALKAVGGAVGSTLNLAADEVSWIATAMFSKLSQQLAELSAVLYKPTEKGAALLRLSQDTEKKAEDILEKGVVEVLMEAKSRYPEAEVPSAEEIASIIEEAKKSIGVSYQTIAENNKTKPGKTTQRSELKKRIAAYEKKYGEIKKDTPPAKGNRTTPRADTKTTAPTNPGNRSLAVKKEAAESILTKIDNWGKTGMTFKELLAKIDNWGKTAGGPTPGELLTKIDNWGKTGMTLTELLTKIDNWGKGVKEPSKREEFDTSMAAYEKKYGEIKKYTPPTMSASDINTPKVRSGLASKRGN